MCIWHGVSARVYMARCVRVRVRARTHVGLERLANEGFNQLALPRQLCRQRFRQPGAATHPSTHRRTERNKQTQT